VIGDALHLASARGLRVERGVFRDSCTPPLDNSSPRNNVPWRETYLVFLNPDLLNQNSVDKRVATLKKPSSPEIPRKTIYRLSLYLRCLARLKENTIETVSSEILAKVAGVKPTQLRKDLTYLGQFGTRGLGYGVAELSKRISDELGTTSLQPVILVGVGHLGLALLSYRGFEKEGFEIVAAFDIDPHRKREKQVNQPILHIDAVPDFAREHKIKMAILTVPAAAAQEVTNLLITSGITGILNFAPIVLEVPEEVMVNNVNLAIELENLSYFIQE